MVRVLIAILLALNLSMCPLRCVGCFAQDDQHPVVPDAGCPCCVPSEDAGRSPSGTPVNDEGCRCQDCVCDGALVSLTEAQTPDSRPLIVWIRREGVLHAGSNCSRPGTPLPDDSPGTPLSGWEARIAHQSLLL